MRAWLHNASAEELHDLVLAKGWYLTHDSSKLALIPTGVITVTISSDGAMGLRWSLSSDQQDTSRVRRILGMLLESFPEMKNASLGYNSYLQYLDVDAA